MKLYLTKVYTDNFRNLSREEINLHPGINIILGKNAQGKTNFLEAVYILAAASSPRSAAEAEMVAWNNDYYYIQGEVTSREEDNFSLSVGYSQGQKRIKINENPLERIRDLLGRLLIIFFGPEDLQLIKGGPQIRRQFLNREISLLQPLYYDYLQRYRSILQQRNNLLKDIAEKNGDPADLEPWDEQLAAAGAELITRRLWFLREMAPLLSEHYRSISGEEGQLQIKYDSRLPLDLKSSREDWQRGFLSAWQRRRSEEIRRGFTLSGPHRDDIRLELEGRDLKNYGSQGQQRTAVLALKIAELKLMDSRRGEKPVLLLDDVFSELDGNRQQALLQLMGKDQQTVITTTDNNWQGLDRDCYYFTVEQGKIKRWEGRN